MLRVLSVLFLLLAPVAYGHAVSAPQLDDEFNPRLYDTAELRMLHVALAATGDYRGPLDGIWTLTSQDALTNYSSREFGEPVRDLHAAALIITLYADLEARGWEQRQIPGLGLSVALPAAVFLPPEPESQGQRWWSSTGSLTLLTNHLTPEMTLAWHEAARGANSDATLLEIRRDAALLVTAGALPDGRFFYTRSDLIGTEWSTIYVASAADEADMANLIRASIDTGEPAPWQLPGGGRLDALVRQAIELIEQPPELLDFFPPASGTSLPDAANAASGTGFFVGPDTIVTAAHVIQGCHAITLKDGSTARLIARDPDLDVAILASGTRAASWLELARDDHARLGQSVHAAGYPYYNIAGTSLHLTGGNVSSLADLNDDSRFFSFSAPVQPGNSGGPLIGQDGRVVGLVVSRLSERFIAEATGTLPQNINYALSSPDLTRFLAANNVVQNDPGLGAFGLESGAPDGFLAAVVPVLCD